MEIIKGITVFIASLMLLAANEINSKALQSSEGTVWTVGTDPHASPGDHKTRTC